MSTPLKHIFFSLLLICMSWNLHAQVAEEIKFDSLDYQRIIPPERFGIIENTSFELNIEPENYTHPIQSFERSSRFGLRNVKFTSKYEMGVHRGIDIIARTGTPVYAMFDGVVRISRHESKGYGNVVVIRHQDGLETLYAHLDCRYVVEGQKVYSGKCIGLSGNTGTSTGAHLHLELSIPTGRFDPELLIDFQTGTLKYTENE